MGILAWNGTFVERPRRPTGEMTSKAKKSKKAKAGAAAAAAAAAGGLPAAAGGGLHQGGGGGGHAGGGNVDYPILTNRNSSSRDNSIIIIKVLIGIIVYDLDVELNILICAVAF